MRILDAVMLLRPGTTWNLRGDVLEQCEGEAPVVPPTKEEIDAVLQSDSYKDKRKMEYPSIADQLDALWKGGQAQSDMQTKIAAIKAKHPKP